VIVGPIPTSRTGRSCTWSRGCRSGSGPRHDRARRHGPRRRDRGRLPNRDRRDRPLRRRIGPRLHHRGRHPDPGGFAVPPVPSSSRAGKVARTLTEGEKARVQENWRAYVDLAAPTATGGSGDGGGAAHEPVDWAPLLRRGCDPPIRSSSPRISTPTATGSGARSPSTISWPDGPDPRVSTTRRCRTSSGSSREPGRSRPTSRRATRARSARPTSSSSSTQQRRAAGAPQEDVAARGR